MASRNTQRAVLVMLVSVLAVGAGCGSDGNSVSDDSYEVNPSNPAAGDEFVVTYDGDVGEGRSRVWLVQAQQGDEWEDEWIVTAGREGVPPVYEAYSGVADSDAVGLSSSSDVLVVPREFEGELARYCNEGKRDLCLEISIG